LRPGLRSNRHQLDPPARDGFIKTGPKTPLPQPQASARVLLGRGRRGHRSLRQGMVSNRKAAVTRDDLTTGGCAWCLASSARRLWARPGPSHTVEAATTGRKRRARPLRQQCA
jgi:hypothetical protein